MNNRYELEQLIMSAWSTKEDLEAMLWKMMDSENIPNEDYLSNILIGIIHLHDVRSERLFNMYEQMIKNREI